MTFSILSSLAVILETTVFLVNSGTSLLIILWIGYWFCSRIQERKKSTLATVYVTCKQNERSLMHLWFLKNSNTLQISVSTSNRGGEGRPHRIPSHSQRPLITTITISTSCPGTASIQKCWNSLFASKHKGPSEFPFLLYYRSAIALATGNIRLSVRNDFQAQCLHEPASVLGHSTSFWFCRISFHIS